MAVKHGLDIPECPDGNLFGGDEVPVLLYSPNGRLQETGSATLEGARRWGEQQKQKLLSRRIGDGAMVKEHRDLVLRLYGEGQWYVRVHTGTYTHGNRGGGETNT